MICLDDIVNEKIAVANTPGVEVGPFDDPLMNNSFVSSSYPKEYIRSNSRF